MAHGHKSNEKVVYVGDSRVRKKDNRPIPPDYTAFPGKSEAFIPNFLLKEWMVGAVVLVGFLVLTIAEAAPLGYPADPTNTAFIPMPDWYFLFMYQLLKYPYTSDAYVVMGTVAVPGLMFGALMLAPFLDTGKERRFYRRPIASTLMFLGLLAVIYLTKVSWSHYQEELAIKNMVPEHIEREEKAREAAEKGQPAPNKNKNQEIALVAPDDPAKELMKTATCLSCHGDNLKGGNGFPSLRGIGDKLTKDDILGIIHNGQGGMPAMTETAKGKGLTDADIEKMADWLSKQKKAQ